LAILSTSNAFGEEFDVNSDELLTSLTTNNLKNNVANFKHIHDIGLEIKTCLSKQTTNFYFLVSFIVPYVPINLG